MIDFSQMLARFVAALILGALIGLEREMVGKEVGIRTGMMVSAGATIFSIIGLALPYIMTDSAEKALQMATVNGGYLNIIANIVIGIGFLGTGIIMKNENRVHGLTSAAVIWVTAAVGVLVGLGMLKFAVVSTFIIVTVLYALRRIDIADKVRSE